MSSLTVIGALCTRKLSKSISRIVNLYLVQDHMPAGHDASLQYGQQIRQQLRACNPVNRHLLQHTSVRVTMSNFPFTIQSMVIAQCSPSTDLVLCVLCRRCLQTASPHTFCSLLRQHCTASYMRDSSPCLYYTEGPCLKAIAPQNGIQRDSHKLHARQSVQPHAIVELDICLCKGGCI